MRIKKGSEVHGLTVQALLAWTIANQVYESHGFECWLTAGTDGKHMAGSKHYTGEAIDLRTRNIKPQTKINVIAGQIAERLGDDFDVVVEATHLHIEYHEH